MSSPVVVAVPSVAVAVPVVVAAVCNLLLRAPAKVRGVLSKLSNSSVGETLVNSPNALRRTRRHLV